MAEIESQREAERWPQLAGREAGNVMPFPLHLVVYPGMVLPLHVFEERYRSMIRECFEHKKPFGFILIKEVKEVGGSAVPSNAAALSFAIAAKLSASIRIPAPVRQD